MLLALSEGIYILNLIGESEKQHCSWFAINASKTEIIFAKERCQCQMNWYIYTLSVILL